MTEYVDKGAIISPDGKYRYKLWREWRSGTKPLNWHWWEDRGKPVLDGKGYPVGAPMSCVFIMLNPSTADGETDDPTIRRCVGFAKHWGYDRLEVFNLFAYRATDPNEIIRADYLKDVVGPENSNTFGYMQGSLTGLIVCAWGAHGAHMGQDETTLGWLGDMPRYALGTTKDGHPRHPLYLPYDTPLVRFRP